MNRSDDWRIQLSYPPDDLVERHNQLLDRLRRLVACFMKVSKIPSGHESSPRTSQDDSLNGRVFFNHRQRLDEPFGEFIIDRIELSWPVKRYLGYSARCRKANNICRHGAFSQDICRLSIP